MTGPAVAKQNLPFPAGYYRAEAKYAELLKQVGLVDGMSVFEHPKIEVWRSITERENCVLDFDGGRLHIKRNKKGHQGVDAEADAIRLLIDAKIDTVPLAAAGRLNDGRGFLITEDLAGYEDAEILVKNGLAFETILAITADLAGRLHKAGLHHRDLYLCHFYVGATPASPANGQPRPSGDAGVAPTSARIMDAGRVRALPKWFRTRWLVKDIAQFVYSARKFGVAEELVQQWLAKYEAVSGTKVDASFRRAIERKVKFITRHDAELRKRDPTRNVSIDR
ncbi:MAG: lipopolysaccharide kinase InaA family protein [Tepidisphaeraceae bacterium]